MRTVVLSIWMLAVLAVACGPGVGLDSQNVDGGSEGRAFLPPGAEDAPVWIFFADAGALDESFAAREEALAGIQLSEKTIERRVKLWGDSGGSGDERLAAQPGARWGDILPDPAYVAALKRLGLEVRGKSGWLNAISVEGLNARTAEVLALPFVREVRPVARRAPRPVLQEMSPGALGVPGDPLGDEALVLPEPGESPASSLGRNHDEPLPSPYDYGSGFWQANAVFAPALHGSELTGQGVTVGVMDTGFRLSHSSLSPLVPQVLGQWDAISGDTVVDDEDGDAAGQADHGSAVLSCLAGRDEGNLFGIAPEISLLLGKTERIDQEEPYEEDYWVYGVTWAEQNGAQLVTSSLGWRDWYTDDDMDGATATSTLFAESITAETGILLINSAGNEGSAAGSIVAPADAPSVLAVGAVDEAQDLASFSSRGPTADGRIKPDVVAPGKQVWIADWDTASDLRYGSGTSYAAPIVAGISALLFEAHPEWGREDVVEALRTTASAAGNPGNDLGYGLVNGWEACGLACSCHDSDQDGAYDLNCGGEDCDDRDPRRAPGEPEVCDGLDNDCDLSLPTDEQDLDSDGQRPCEGDCNDTNAVLNGFDLDEDGASLCQGDCADGDPERFPDATEIPYDGVDQDCDGEDLVDQDGDGVNGGPEGADCDDMNPAIYPDPVDDDGNVLDTGGHEFCFDGRDNDCDGKVGSSDPDCQNPARRSPTSLLESNYSFSSSGCSILAPQVGPGPQGSGSRGLLAGLAFAAVLGVRRARERKRCRPSGGVE